MDILDKIDILIGEDGECTAGTTTTDVAKVPMGTKKMKKKKKKKKLEIKD